MKASLKKDIESVLEQIDSIISDNTIPRNIRNSMDDARKKIMSSKDDRELEVSLAQAIYTLDEALNDINLPFHARPDIMGVISDLEALKEKIK